LFQHEVAMRSALFSAALIALPAFALADPLPSWNDTDAKAAITGGNLRLAALSTLAFFVAGGVLLATVPTGGAVRIVRGGIATSDGANG
jgi:hypothetical protein